MLRGLKQFSLPEIEEKILELWRTNQILQKSLAGKGTLSKKRKTFVFYEGPPTANGRPGIHHVLARVFKDIIPRYKTMRGFFVPRKGGWDTHGLPVELEVEKALGLKSKKEIELFGIAAFNEKCKESVWKYKDEWERLTERIGFWLDLKDPYVTYENSYIESLWWIIKQIWEKKLLYKGHKVVPWCTRCGTALSSHELAQGYREVENTSVYVKFRLEKGQRVGKFETNDATYILAWTTTPWTLPGNVALAVGKDIEYVILKSKESGEFYILAKERAATLGIEGTEHSLVKGSDLVSLRYEPLFRVTSLVDENSYKIYTASFVSTEEGTGVVHTAVMYGEDDYELGKKIGLPEYHTVDEQGRFVKEVKELAGLYVNAKEAEEKIIAYLKHRSLLFKSELYKHEYPFCWRCGTSLLYYARDSWFIRMSKFRGELLKTNKKINWIPEHLKNGRFGEWLKEAKDWAISRERYWGTPLPVWQCGTCRMEHVVGGAEEFETLGKTSGNRYILLRHGEGEQNLKDVINTWPEKDIYHLTLRGRTEVEKTARELKKKRIELIFSSDITRTKETAEMVRTVIGLEKVHYDQRLREINTGDFNGCHDALYHRYFSSLEEKFTKRPPNGETLTELRARLFEFMQDIEARYKNKTVLVVSHEYPIWMLQMVMRGWSLKEAIEEKERRGDDFLETGEYEETSFRVAPRDKTGVMDFHRPYIDTVELVCPSCKNSMRRVSEVIDVWFDSGSMPFAQAHFPFENKKIDFPADYISEGVDQTRGWFYTLLAVATLLKKGTPYKNVISLGLILDKNGQKMSKSKGNIVDPWAMIQKYGADAIRWYFYVVNSPGESKRFDEADLGKVQRQFFSTLYNSFIFWDTYAEKNVRVARKKLKAKHVLDLWIITRLHETIGEVTKRLDLFDIGGAARSIEDFTGDLSRWYIRRSRRRFQPSRQNVENKDDYVNASQTLRYVLVEISKLLAPFTPFFSDSLYYSLGFSSGSSVHLEAWPKKDTRFSKKEILEDMREVRRIASLVFAKRAECGLKVRQPLQELKIKNEQLKGKKEILFILAEEANVKKIVFDSRMSEEILLDTNITHELKEEGLLREFIRLVQDLRQHAKLEPRDTIALLVETSEELRHVLGGHEGFVKKELNASFLQFQRTEKFTVELDTHIGEWKLWVALRKLH